MGIKFEKVKKPRLYIQEWNCKKKKMINGLRITIWNQNIESITLNIIKILIEW